MRIQKSTLMLTLLFCFLILSCSSGNKFVVKNSQNEKTILNIGSAKIVVQALYEESFGIRLILTASSETPAFFYPYRMKIEYGGSELICDVMKKMRLVVKNPIPLNKHEQFIGYSCNEYFQLEKGDEILIYGENIVKQNNRYISLDSLYFELK